jgi:hypothetical protein
MSANGGLLKVWRAQQQQQQWRAIVAAVKWWFFKIESRKQ